YVRESARCDVWDHIRPATDCGGRCQCSWVVLLVVIVGGFLCSPGNLAPLGTSSTSSMSGLAQASVLASSLAGRAGARPSQARARSCFPPGNVEHQLDGRPGSSLCAGQQPRRTSWCSLLPE